jgi:hypothetical protein
MKSECEARRIFTTEYTEAGWPDLKDTETGLEGLGGKTGLEGFNSEPNKRLRLTPPLASRGAGTNNGKLLNKSEGKRRR